MEYLNIILHPSIILFLSAILLRIFYKYDKIFGIISVLAPLISLFLLNYSEGKIYLHIANISLIYKLSYDNLIIGSAFSNVLFAANIIAVSQNRKLEVIYGTAYGAASIFCILANDYISIFLSLELMMIFSSIIIFMGGKTGSITSAKKYFLTHFLSGNMILFGFIYMINKTGSIEITNLTNLYYDEGYSSFALSVMLIGMIINIAAVPFSGWMIYYYSKSSPSGFIYLISFTTKVSIVLIIKFFSGFEDLKIVGSVMICYSCYKMIYENNINRYLSYLSINAMGFMLIGISVGYYNITYALYIYLGFHIIYKLLLTICLLNISNSSSKIDDLNRPNNIFIIVGLIISIAFMLCIPGSGSYYAKKIIFSHFNDQFYLLISLSTFITAYSLPWKQFLIKNNQQSIKQITVTSNVIIIILLLLFLLINKSLLIGNNPIIILATLKQIAIILLALLISSKFTPKRIKIKSMNLIEVAGKAFFYYFNYFDNKNVKSDIESIENWSIQSLEAQINKRFRVFHNQQTAIFIFILIFIILLFNALFLK